MEALSDLIARASRIRDEYNNFDRSREEEVRLRYTLARRDLFLEMLRLLLEDPALKITDLAELMDVQPMDLPMMIGHDVADWLRSRHYQEMDQTTN